MKLLAAALALALLAPPAAPAGATSDAWRQSPRWGMGVEDVLRSFPGSRRVEPPVRLANGKVVAAGIDGVTIAGTRFQLRFVFDAGRLALVSLRTPEADHPDAEVYASLARHVAAELGGPGEETRDERVVDLRERRWVVGGDRVDLKYLPGVVVLLRSPAPRAP
jgi:hypothetical protein